MKISLNAWSIMPPNATLNMCEEFIKIARNCNYDGFEFCYDDSKFDPAKMDKEFRKKVVEIAEANEITISSVATGVFWKYNLGSKDEELRRKGINYLRAGIELAYDLGAKVLLVVPAVANPNIPYDEMYKIAQESIRGQADYAEEHGVTIAIENVWNKFLYSPMEFKAFIEEIGHEYVKAYLDLGNIANLGYPEHWIDLLKDLIACVHVKDFDINVGNITGFRHLGEGSIDWTTLIRRLKEKGYDYFLVVECPVTFDPSLKKPKYPDDYVRWARHNATFLREVLSKV